MLLTEKLQGVMWNHKLIAQKAQKKQYKGTAGACAHFSLVHVCTGYF